MAEHFKHWCDTHKIEKVKEPYDEDQYWWLCPECESEFVENREFEYKHKD